MSEILREEFSLPSVYMIAHQFFFIKYYGKPKSRLGWAGHGWYMNLNP